MEYAGLLIAAIGITALLCQWLAWRLRLPAILFLLLAGLLVGPVGGWLDPDALFGDLLFPLVSLAVAVILFEGSLTLNLRELGGLSTLVRRMITVAAPVTWAIIAVTTHWLFGIGWDMAILFGALMVVTGPTVITPLLRTVRPNERVANVLRWEGIVIDPVGALLVVVVYEFIATQSQGAAFGQSLLLFVEIIAVGLAGGLAAGVALGHLLAREWLPDYLHNLATLSLVFLVFTGCNYLAHESGLLAVTVMGMWLANRPEVRIHNILNFKENLTILFISGLFIILAARLPREQLLGIFTLAPLLLLLVVQFVARPVSVALATAGSALPWRDRLVLAWIAPRGIVAAAVSALFALRLTEQGHPDAHWLLPLTFAVIMGTVLFQSATARPLARALGAVEPEPRGVLILGAHAVARAIGKALHEQKLPVVLCDSNRENIRAARMEGLRTFYGNPTSEYAGQRLELAGIGKLLALSPLREQNVIACMHFREEFGRNNVFALRPHSEEGKAEKHQEGEELKGRVLFEPGVTYSQLATALAGGADIRATRLSETFDFDAYCRQQPAGTRVLFELTDQGELRPWTGEETPETDSLLLSLVPASARPETPASPPPQSPG